MSVTASKFRAKYFSRRVKNNFYEDDILELRWSEFPNQIENVKIIRPFCCIYCSLIKAMQKLVYSKVLNLVYVEIWFHLHNKRPRTIYTEIIFFSANGFTENPQVNKKIRVLQSSSTPRANRTSGACYFLFLPFDIFFVLLQIYNDDPCVVARHLFLLCFPPRPSRDLLFPTHVVHM